MKSIPSRKSRLAVLLLCLVPLSVNSFTSFSQVLRPATSCPPVGAHCIALKAASKDEASGSEAPLELTMSRRKALASGIMAVSVGTWGMVPHKSLAKEQQQVGSSPDRPIAILGASGRTGMEVAQALAKEGLYSVTMTRSGKDPFQIIKLKPEIKSYIQHFPNTVNVVDRESLKASLDQAHASGIIFCASASPKGGNAFEVDDKGVGNAAEAALDLNARLILVSALAVDRPNSKSYQVTNTLGGNLNGIMDAKLAGENKVREILNKKKDYVIIRPGVLMNGGSRQGPLGLALNQGDTIGGGMSRDELAGVVVGGLLSGKRGVTVEVYRRSTATALQPTFDLPSGKESYSSSYIGLFDSVERE